MREQGPRFVVSAQETVVDFVWPHDLDITLSSHPTRLKTSGSCVMFATPRKAGGLIKIATLFTLSAVRIFFLPTEQKFFLSKIYPLKC